MSGARVLLLNFELSRPAGAAGRLLLSSMDARIAIQYIDLLP
jgi:hypothetical protein